MTALEAMRAALLRISATGFTEDDLFGISRVSGGDLGVLPQDDLFWRIGFKKFHINSGDELSCDTSLPMFYVLDRTKEVYSLNELLEKHASAK